MRPALSQCFPNPLTGQWPSTSNPIACECQQLYALVSICCCVPRTHLLVLHENDEAQAAMMLSHRQQQQAEMQQQQQQQQLEESQAGDKPKDDPTTTAATTKAKFNHSNMITSMPKGPKYVEFTISRKTQVEDLQAFLLRAQAAGTVSAPGRHRRSGSRVLQKQQQQQQQQQQEEEPYSPSSQHEDDEMRGNNQNNSGGDDNGSEDGRNSVFAVSMLNPNNNNNNNFNRQMGPEADEDSAFSASYHNGKRTTAPGRSSSPLLGSNDVEMGTRNSSPVFSRLSLSDVQVRVDGSSSNNNNNNPNNNNNNNPNSGNKAVTFQSLSHDNVQQQQQHRPSLPSKMFAAGSNTSATVVPPAAARQRSSSSAAATHVPTTKQVVIVCLQGLELASPDVRSTLMDVLQFAQVTPPPGMAPAAASMMAGSPNASMLGSSHGAEPRPVPALRVVAFCHYKTYTLFLSEALRAAFSLSTFLSQTSMESAAVLQVSNALRSNVICKPHMLEIIHQDEDNHRIERVYESLQREEDDIRAEEQRQLEMEKRRERDREKAAERKKYADKSSSRHHHHDGSGSGSGSKKDKKKQSSLQKHQQRKESDPFSRTGPGNKLDDVEEDGDDDDKDKKHSKRKSKPRDSMDSSHYTSVFSGGGGGGGSGGGAGSSPLSYYHSHLLHPSASLNTLPGPPPVLALRAFNERDGHETALLSTVTCVASVQRYLRHLVMLIKGSIIGVHSPGVYLTREIPKMLLLLRTAAALFYAGNGNEHTLYYQHRHRRHRRSEQKGRHSGTSSSDSDSSEEEGEDGSGGDIVRHRNTARRAAYYNSLYEYHCHLDYSHIQVTATDVICLLPHLTTHLLSIDRKYLSTSHAPTASPLLRGSTTTATGLLQQQQQQSMVMRNNTVTALHTSNNSFGPSSSFTFTHNMLPASPSGMYSNAASPHATGGGGGGGGPLNLTSTVTNYSFGGGMPLSKSTTFNVFNGTSASNFNNNNNNNTMTTTTNNNTMMMMGNQDGGYACVYDANMWDLMAVRSALQNRKLRTDSSTFFSLNTVTAPNGISSPPAIQHYFHSNAVARQFFRTMMQAASGAGGGSGSSSPTTRAAAALSGGGGGGNANPLMPPPTARHMVTPENKDDDDDDEDDEGDTINAFNVKKSSYYDFNPIDLSLLEEDALDSTRRGTLGSLSKTKNGKGKGGGSHKNPNKNIHINISNLPDYSFSNLFGPGAGSPGSPGSPENVAQLYENLMQLNPATHGGYLGGGFDAADFNYQHTMNIITLMIRNYDGDVNYKELRELIRTTIINRSAPPPG